VRNEQDLAISIADTQRKIGEVFIGRLEQVEAQKVATRMREQIADLEKRRQQALSDIAKAYPDYNRLVRPVSPDLNEVAKSLAPGEAFVSVYAGFDKTYVTAVLADGTVALNVADLNEAKIATLVKSIRRSLDPGDVPLGKIPVFDFNASHLLYKSLFEPLQSQLSSSKVWTVSVSGSLGTLPLSLLTTAPHRHTPDPKLLFSEYQTAPWLNKRVAVAYSPSASATIALRKLPPGNQARKTFLGIGDPQFGERVQVAAAATRSIVARDKPLGLRNMKFQRDQAKTLEAIETAGPELDVSKVKTSLPTEALKAADAEIQSRSAPSTPTRQEEAIPDIPPLPDTRDEIIAIARSLGADPQQDAIFGAAASRERVMSTPLNDRRILAFATHGLIPGDMPGLNQPALTMSYSKDPRDSLLKLEDILKLKLDADWVVLSACNTGAADGIGGEAISGLGRGFFYAGSRALLVTHWPVESESARKLVTEIFSRYSKQTSRAISVQQAAQDLIDSKGYVDPASGRQVYSYAHPMFWAPYTLVGDAR
jgi:CHAT domain-containing protein